MSTRPAAADTGLAHSEALLRPAEANRELVLGELRLGYLLKRATRRTIGFVVGPRGLAVSAPRWVGQPQIDHAVQLKADWILRKLAEQGQRLVQLDAARIDWRDGVRLPYLGEDLLIRCAPTLTRSVLQAPPPLHDPPRTLHLRLPADATPAQACRWWKTVQGRQEIYLQALVEPAEWEARELAAAPAPDLGTGRELFAMMRAGASEAEAGGSAMLAAAEL